MVERDAVPAGELRKLALGRRRELSGGHYEPPARSWLTGRTKESDRKAQPDDWQNAAAERREARSRESESTLPTTGASLGAPPPLIEGRERSEGVPDADQTIRAAQRWLCGLFDNLHCGQCEERQRRSNPALELPKDWIASLRSQRQERERAIYSSAIPPLRQRSCPVGTPDRIRA